MSRNVIISIGVFSALNEVLAQIQVKKVNAKHKGKIKKYYMQLNKKNNASNEMNMWEFNRILSSMTDKELGDLKKNIEGDKNKAIFENCINQELMKRYVNINAQLKYELFSLGVKTSQMVNLFTRELEDLNKLLKELKRNPETFKPIVENKKNIVDIFEEKSR